MKILVTGASSLPGYKCVVEALSRGHEVVALHFTHEIPCEHRALRKIRLDVTDTMRLKDLIVKERPEVVYHIAAYGDVDGCERDRRKAWKINVEATVALAEASELVNAFVVYLSTDYVFDGERGMYREDEPPCPVNYYGLTKLMGEVAVMSRCSRWAVVRASSIYGLGPGRKNFAKFLIEKLSKGEPVKALVDQYTSPSNSRLLAEALLEIGEYAKTGVFHIVGERMSRYEFATRLAETLGFDKSLIGEARMSDFKWFAKRPRDSSLSYEYTRGRMLVDFYSNARAFSVLKEEYEAMLKR